MPIASSRWSQVGVVETTVSGRVLPSDIEALVGSFREVAGGRPAVWVVRGERVTGYDRAAVERAVTLFSELVRESLLPKLVAVLPVPTVRMGAAVVSMGMRAAGYPLDLVVVASGDELPQHLPSRI